ncbi:MAG: hypothetical protein HKN23_03495 [Verrucomicrobiales bacterium]|nr:hypothetical protein [Verrucomicrobiales bacterium]
MSAEITEKSGEPVTLVSGAGGIFEIRREGEVIWKKQRSGHFPEPGEAADLFG